MVDVALAPADAAVIHVEKMGAVARVARGMSHDVAELVEDAASTIHQALAHGHGEDRLAAAASTLSRVAMIARQLESISCPASTRTTPRGVGIAVGEILPMVRRLAGDGITVVVDQLDTSLWANAAVGQLEQVVFHLVVNGRDAMPGGGRLGVSVRRETIAAARPHRYGVLSVGEWVVLAISDSGVGMTAATLSHLFEPFFTTKAPGLGSGLGLATVYGIARHLEGQVVVDSTVGAGTTVALWLPLVSAPVAAATPAVNGTEQVAVLVVDDDEWVRAVTARTLRRAGYGVLEAESGRQALALLNDVAGRSIQAVVSDVGMSSRADVELARRVRAEHPQVRVVLMTGCGPEAAASLAGVGDAVLQKPFSRAELFGALGGA
jgi:CheY-like chemotaxis protein